MTALPEDWTIHWEPDAPPGALRLTPAAIAAADALSVVFRRDGLRPWGRDGFPLGPADIIVRAYPRLDEIWCLWMWSELERGGQPAPHWDAVSQYVDDCRHGHWTDRVPTSKAVQSVYASILHYELARTTADRSGFLEAALLLCSHVDARLRDGARLLDDVVTDHPRLQRYVSVLEADEQLYREDVARGLRRVARIEGAAAPRSVSMLVLRHPVAAQFKLWARRDARSPTGDGYALLLVESNESVVLTADPARRIELGWLAGKLDSVERTARGDGAAHWYDGSRHDGTVIAAPTDGTKLSLAQILSVLNDALRLRRPSSRTRRRTLMAGTAATAVAAAGLALIASERQGAAPTQPLTAAILNGVEARRILEPVTLMITAGNEIGTGVAIGDGFVLTCFHVVQNAPRRVPSAAQGSVVADYRMDVVLAKPDGTSWTGSVVKVDPAADLALVHAKGLPEELAIHLASGDAEAGAAIHTLGNGKEGMRFTSRTSTVGNVGVWADEKAALAIPCDAPDCASLDATKRALQRQYPGRALQSDFDLTRGDSGGPVVNDKGELVGINLRVVTSGVSLHVPVGTIRAFQEAPRPKEPLYRPPAPRSLASEQHAELQRIDLDGDRQYESVLVSGRAATGPRVIFIDLTNRTAMTRGGRLTSSEVEQHHASVAVLRDGAHTLAYYDDDDSGTFERIVLERDGTRIALRVSGDQGVRAAASPPGLLDGRAAHLKDAILRALGSS